MRKAPPGDTLPPGELARELPRDRAGFRCWPSSRWSIITLWDDLRGGLLLLSGLLPRLSPVPTRPGPPGLPLGSARAGVWGSPDGDAAGGGAASPLASFTSPRARMTLGMRPRSSDHASFARSALSTRSRGEGVLVSDVPVLVRSADRPKAAE